jgi:hypothetical protein
VLPGEIVRTQMIKTMFLVPVRDNAGEPFPESAWFALEERLARFGGFSWRAGVTGVWSAGGQIYRDRSREYTVSLESWTQPAGWLDVVRWAGRRFRQRAMYIEVAGLPEVLWSPSR